MRRIDDVKSKKMKNIKEINILDKKRIQVIFNNNHEIVLLARAEYYGDDSGMYFEKE